MSSLGTALKARELLKLAIAAIADLPPSYTRTVVEVRNELALAEVDDLVTQLAGPECVPAAERRAL